MCARSSGSATCRRLAHARGGPRQPSANAGKIAVASKAALEAARTCHPVRLQGFTPIVPLLDQRFAHTEPMAFNRRAPIGAHADLREAGDLVRQLLRLGARSALGGEIFAQAYVDSIPRREPYAP